MCLIDKEICVLEMEVIQIIGVIFRFPFLLAPVTNQHLQHWIFVVPFLRVKKILLTRCGQRLHIDDAGTTSNVYKQQICHHGYTILEFTNSWK